MKNLFIFIILVFSSSVFFLIKTEITESSFYVNNSNVVIIKLTTSNEFYIDGTRTTINEIKYACSYGGCAGPMPNVHLYLDKKISMDKLELIEKELQEVDALRVKYFKL